LLQRPDFWRFRGQNSLVNSTLEAEMPSLARKKPGFFLRQPEVSL
jgi:hypothetical protein